jgi:flavodoxin/NAD-dependent dihydropyrimidine dehydrogenase PreA subunit
MIKILIIIFSATGNTAKIAEVIQQELKQLGADIEEKDITSYDDRNDPLDLTPYHAVVFGFPIYARRAPRIVREWLDTLDGQGKLCATFFTYGGFTVHPIHFSTREILENRGFDLVSSAEFLAKHTFNIGGWSAMENRPNESDLGIAREFANQTYKRFVGEDPGRPDEFDKTELTQEKLDEEEKLPLLAITQLPSRMGADCSMCMICEELCPTHAMNAEMGEVSEKEKCIACLRCIDNCPEDVLSINDLRPVWPLALDMTKETEESVRKKRSKIYL